MSNKDVIKLQNARVKRRDLLRAYSKANADFLSLLEKQKAGGVIISGVKNASRRDGITAALWYAAIEDAQGDYQPPYDVLVRKTTVEEVRHALRGKSYYGELRFKTNRELRCALP